MKEGKLVEWDSEINALVKKRQKTKLLRTILRPVLDCVVCMASFWTFVIFSLEHYQIFTNSKVALAIYFAVCVAGFNHIIECFVKEK